MVVRRVVLQADMIRGPRQGAGDTLVVVDFTGEREGGREKEREGERGREGQREGERERVKSEKRDRGRRRYSCGG